MQYIGSGEPQRLVGEIVLPYNDSFSVLLVEMEGDFFNLVAVGDISAQSKVIEDDESGDERS